MSHSYFLYETGPQKLERLRRQRMDRIKKRLREARLYVSRQTDIADDMAAVMPGKKPDNGGFMDMAVDTDELKSRLADITMVDNSSFSSDGTKRERVDLSAYLERDEQYAAKQRERIDTLIARMDEYAPDSDKARHDYNRMMNNINEIIGNEAIDRETVIDMVEDRVNIYIENRNYDNSVLDEDLLIDYKALCVLLGKEEEIIPPEKLKNRVDAMLDEYSALADRELVAEVIGEALEGMGMKVEGLCVLDKQIEGELYSGGKGDCKVFVSCDDAGIMIEPLIDAGNMSKDEAQNAQRKVCKAESVLVEEAEKNGVTLKKVYAGEHPVSEMAAEDDIELDKMNADSGDELERIRGFNRMRRKRRNKEQSRSIDI